MILVQVKLSEFGEKGRRIDSMRRLSEKSSSWRSVKKLISEGIDSE
jgi:hypothetical protein